MGDKQQQSSTTSGPYRRDVMKVLGVGTAAAAFSGVAATDQHEDDSTEEEPPDTVEDGDGEGTVHVVRTLISQSTNPQRPADFFYQPTGLHIEPGDVIKYVFETPDHTVTSYHPAFGMQRRVPSGVQPFSSPIMGWDPQSLPEDADMPPSLPGEPGGEDGETPVEGTETPEEGTETPMAGTETPVEGTETPVEGGETDGEMGGPEPSTWLHSFDTPGVYDIECAPHEGFGMAMRVVVGDETETAFETSSADELPPPRAGPVGFAREVLTDPNLEPEAIVEAGRVEWMDLELNQQSTNGEENGTSTETETETETGTGTETSD